MSRIIYLFAAQEGFFDDTIQQFAFIRCDLVAVVEGGGGDGELLIGAPDDEVGVTANGDRSFLWREGYLSRRVRAEPSRHILQREPAVARFGPNNRQTELKRRDSSNTWKITRVYSYDHHAAK